ncbi:MAG: cupredoxin domain-containing protein [Firmicutes bacterium]|nr:cupredoxin domain-containing protein [Bacillota bacterium]
MAAGGFTVAALTVLGVAIVLVVNPLRVARSPDPSAAAPNGDTRRVLITMAGFAPAVLRVPAGRPFAVRLVNPDSPYHTDGGGWHQFRVERLGVDVRVPPRSERMQVFAGLAAGTYEFYCDVCCGGKENPTMRGVIEVTG